MVIAIGLHLLHSEHQILASPGLADQQNSLVYICFTPNIKSLHHRALLASRIQQPHRRALLCTPEPTMLHIYFSCLDISIEWMQTLVDSCCNLGMRTRFAAMQTHRPPLRLQSYETLQMITSRLHASSYMRHKNARTTSLSLTF